MDFRPRNQRLDGLSPRNQEAGWTFVQEPGGWMDYRPGTRRLVELLSRNLMVGFLEQCLPLSQPGSVFQCVVQLPLGRLKDGTRCVRIERNRRIASEPGDVVGIRRSFLEPGGCPRPGVTVLRRPRQDYYRYLFGFRIMSLGSWRLSSSYDVFYFCGKSLSGLEDAGMGVMTQVPGFAAFHVWRSRVLTAPCTFHIGTLGTPMCLRLHRGFSTLYLYLCLLRCCGNWHVSYDAPCGWMQGSEPELLSTGTWGLMSCPKPG
ncbi:hypothetical protein DY000_02006427 [Brassica cretica]|uniref:Uncharacterized protein n=1 Tax=Brassica cretica TaxID=69181 RepID=A0ABQ7CMC6_BRACR|nr:hypothetical protein DY000_02006427 [Brassica cretica]